MGNLVVFLFSSWLLFSSLLSFCSLFSDNNCLDLTISEYFNLLSKFFCLCILNFVPSDKNFNLLLLSLLLFSVSSLFSVFFNNFLFLSQYLSIFFLIIFSLFALISSWVNFLYTLKSNCFNISLSILPFVYEFFILSILFSHFCFLIFVKLSFNVLISCLILSFSFTHLLCSFWTFIKTSLSFFKSSILFWTIFIWSFKSLACSKFIFCSNSFSNFAFFLLISLFVEM